MHRQVTLMILQAIVLYLSKRACGRRKLDVDFSRTIRVLSITKLIIKFLIRKVDQECLQVIS